MNGISNPNLRITIHNHKVNGKIELNEAPIRSDQLTQIEF